MPIILSFREIAIARVRAESRRCTWNTGAPWPISGSTLSIMQNGNKVWARDNDRVSLSTAGANPNRICKRAVNGRKERASGDPPRTMEFFPRLMEQAERIPEDFKIVASMGMLCRRADFRFRPSRPAPADAFSKTFLSFRLRSEGKPFSMLSDHAF